VVLPQPEWPMMQVQTNAPRSTHEVDASKTVTALPPGARLDFFRFLDFDERTRRYSK